MRITKIERQKRYRGRTNIYADGKFLVGVSAETLLRHGIKSGDDIDSSTLTALVRTEGLLNAKRTALRYLARRPRTEREVRDKLREQDFSSEEIAATISDLKETKLLDDEAFARMYVRDALALRPSGELLLKRKMLLLGVARPVVDQAVNDAFAARDQTDIALAAAKKFLAKSRRRTVTAAKKRNSVAQFLTRRGYTWDTIQRVLKAMFRPGPHESLIE